MKNFHKYSHMPSTSIKAQHCKEKTDITLKGEKQTIKEEQTIVTRKTYNIATLRTPLEQEKATGMASFRTSPPCNAPSSITAAKVKGFALLKQLHYLPFSVPRPSLVPFLNYILIAPIEDGPNHKHHILILSEFERA
ncbi:hypothetical protein AMTR_s00159p00059050 [Amborella trichopoda]|uniref:Uncharacterized protein n=1 Tax=Amborella trichopoda TaxID=13333 RepID=W1PVL0_AMBTC|nr:hypothetical protein AMTR_s00159p00059050 [Amborella trichopoda]